MHEAGSPPTNFAGFYIYRDDVYVNGADINNSDIGVKQQLNFVWIDGPMIGNNTYIYDFRVITLSGTLSVWSSPNRSFQIIEIGRP